MRFGNSFLAAAVKAYVHALVPQVFQSSTTDSVHRLHDELQRSSRRDVFRRADRTVRLGKTLKFDFRAIVLEVQVSFLTGTFCCP